MRVANESAFWRIVRTDSYRYGNGVSLGALVRLYWSVPGFRYTFWMRLANYTRRTSLIWRPWHYVIRVILHWQSVKYGVSIPYNTRIGPGLYIGHFGGIVVNNLVVIGRDCNINHGVTIGVKYGGKNPGTPVIGDRVFLGSGCVIIGGIKIGNDAAVGPNAVVVESVPESGVVTGVAANLVSSNGSSEYVINTGFEEVQKPQ